MVVRDLGSGSGKPAAGLPGHDGFDIVGREDRSLYDREVDLNLIEPAGMDGEVDQINPGPFPIAVAWSPDPEVRSVGLIPCR